MAEAGELREQVEQLRREVADPGRLGEVELEELIPAPSSDGLGKPAPKSLRKRGTYLASAIQR